MAELNQELARRWQRLWGALLDSLILMVIIFPAMWFFGVFEQISSSAEQMGYMSSYGGSQEALSMMTNETRIFVFAFGIGAFLVINGHLLAKYGQTIGKRMVGTRIVSCEDGRILPFWTVFPLRYLSISLVSQIPVAGQWFSPII